jgi:tetratricopeptide (TPR) repeat protein
VTEDPSVIDKDRNVIPRWRNFKTTVTLGELNSSDDFQSPWATPNDDFLLSKLSAWHIYRSVPFAADVVSAAFVLCRYEEAKEAAKFILQQSHEVSDTLKELADQILNPKDEVRRTATLQELCDPDPEHVRHTIHRLRTRLRSEPRNSILYVELSRAYTLLDQKDQAKQAMRMALRLAPSNRFVLRSASRLLLHTQDIGEAHEILRKADATKFDPWLLSAEIAVASSANRSSHYVKAGQRMVSELSEFPFEITELASALGTLEFHNGKSRDARKLFRKALIQPTENSVAQIEWASRRIEGLDFVDATQIRVPRNYEARAWENFTNGEWRDGFKESWNWFYDQPFSARPGHLGSYIASSVLRNYSESERLIEHSLRSNPDDVVLLNNLAFTYASAGRIKEAEEALNKVSQVEPNSSLDATIKATRGLLSFRKGNHSRGRQLYSEAIATSKKFDRSFQALAALFYAREEILANTQYAQEAKEFALEVSNGVKKMDIVSIRQYILQLDVRSVDEMR